jgi:hypothetical protein
MQTYSSILLTSLLFAGVAVHSSQFELEAARLHQSDFESQLLTNKLSAKSDCPDSGQSPLPGCGRRDKDVSKNNGFEH